MKYEYIHTDFYQIGIFIVLEGHILHMHVPIIIKDLVGIMVMLRETGTQNFS